MSAKSRPERELPRAGARDRSMCAMDRPGRESGLSLVELMVALAMLLFVIGGVGAFYLSNRTARISEEISQTMESELRLAMYQIVFNIRGAGFGVPASVRTWIPAADGPWSAAGTDANPLIAQSGSTAANPLVATSGPTVWIALCPGKPVGTVNADTASGSTSVVVNAAAATALDTAGGKEWVIHLNDLESALVTATDQTTNTLTVTTQPGLSTGLVNAYRPGAPICRVDVVRFGVSDGGDALTMSVNERGATATTDRRPIVDGITGLNVARDTTVPQKFTVTLTASAFERDPAANAALPPTRTMSSTVARRN